MREIKFRGRALYDSCGEKVDKLVIGDLSREWNKVTIFDENDGDVYEVDPNSVAQLVGHDSNGHEVYEGDKLTDGKYFNYEASLQPSVEWQSKKNVCVPKDWRYMPLDFTKKFVKLTVEAAS